MSGKFLKASKILAAITAGVVCLLVGYAVTPPAGARVSDQDSLVFRNFNERETLGDLTYRWSRASSDIVLPQVGSLGSADLAVDLWLPAARPPVPLTLAARGAPPLVLPTSSGLHTLHLLMPRSALASGDLQVQILSQPWVPPGDPRVLGIAVRGATLQGLTGALPPPRQLLVIPALILVVALLLMRLGWSTSAAAGTSAFIGIGLALAAGLWPLSVAPYSHRLLLIAGLAYAATFLWATVVQHKSLRWHVPTEVGAIALVILLGIAHWMALPYQWALCAEVGRAVCPRPGHQILGPLTLAALLVLAGLPRLTPERRGIAAVVILALGAVAAGAYATAFSLGRSGPDFFIHWRAAYNFHLGRPLYPLAEIYANHFGHGFKLTPFYAMLFLPFATSNDIMVLLGHRIMNVVFYLTTGALLARMLRPRLGRAAAIASVAIVMGLMQPAFDTIAYGQTDIVLLLLLTVALVALQQERAWLTGLAFALAIMIKVYPLLWLPFLFGRREWKSLGWIAAWLAVLNGMAIAVMGWQNHVIFYTQVLPRLGGGTSWVENQTINGFLSRLLTGTMTFDVNRDPLIMGLTYACFAMIAGVSLLLGVLRSDRRSSDFALQFSILGVVMVLAVNAAWMHYSTVTVLPFTALLWRTAERPVSPPRAAGLALAFCLIAFGNPWTYFTGSVRPGLPLLALSYKTYGLVLLWGVMIAALSETDGVRVGREHALRLGRGAARIGYGRAEPASARSR